MLGKDEKKFVQGTIAELVIAFQNRNRIMAANGLLEATKGGNDSPLREFAIEELAHQIGASKTEN